MSVIKISEELQKKIWPFDIIEKAFINKKIRWILDWRYKKSTELTTWLEKQVTKPTAILNLTAGKIKDYKDQDRQAIEVLRYVQKNLKYKGDKEHWDVPEKWSTADETITSSGYYEVNGKKTYYEPWEGDCEDGAILLYVLCRLKGIPASQLMIIAGDVTGGGHAWLAYRPKEYPLNFLFLDWCYWYTPVLASNRNIFTTVKKTIIEHSSQTHKKIPISNYKKIWIIFNENKSNTEVQYEFKK